MGALATTHEAAEALIATARHGVEMLHALRAARATGRWGNFCSGDDSARNAVRQIEASLERSLAGVEALVFAAAQIPAGAALTLRGVTGTDLAPRGRRAGTRRNSLS